MSWATIYIIQARGLFLEFFFKGKEDNAMKKLILSSVMMLLTIEAQAVNFDHIQFDEEIDTALLKAETAKAKTIYEGFVTALERENKKPYESVQVAESRATTAAVEAAARVEKDQAKKDPRIVALKAEHEKLVDQRLADLKVVEIYRDIGNGNSFENERTLIEAQCKAGAAFDRLLEINGELNHLRTELASQRSIRRAQEPSIYDFFMPDLSVSGQQFWAAKSAIQRLFSSYSVLVSSIEIMSNPLCQAGQDYADEEKLNAAKALRKFLRAEERYDWLYDLISKKYPASDSASGSEVLGSGAAGAAAAGSPKDEDA